MKNTSFSQKHRKYDQKTPPFLRNVECKPEKHPFSPKRRRCLWSELFTQHFGTNMATTSVCKWSPPPRASGSFSQQPLKSKSSVFDDQKGKILYWTVLSMFPGKTNHWQCCVINHQSLRSLSLSAWSINSSCTSSGIIVSIHFGSISSFQPLSQASVPS